jgi:hypothetical protein
MGSMLRWLGLFDLSESCRVTCPDTSSSYSFANHHLKSFPTHSLKASVVQVHLPPLVTRASQVLIQYFSFLSFLNPQIGRTLAQSPRRYQNSQHGDKPGSASQRITLSLLCCFACDTVAEPQSDYPVLATG